MKNFNEDVLDADRKGVEKSSGNNGAKSDHQSSYRGAQHISVVKDGEISAEEELELIHQRLDFLEERAEQRSFRRWIPTLRGESHFSRISTIKWAIAVALVLGLIAFFVVRQVQWNAALSEFRAEPGIQITGVRNIGLKRQLIGLRDPLAPNPYEILRHHNISLRFVDMRLSEYHSLNTAYDAQRRREQKGELEKMRHTLIGVVGDLSEGNRIMRDSKLGEISERLLEMRFPSEMQALNFGYRNGIWHAEGDILAREYSEFRREASKYIFTGSVDLENLDNYAHEKSAALIEGIEAIDLLAEDYEGNAAHAPRLGRFIKELDAVRRQSGLKPSRLQLKLGTSTPDVYVEKLARVSKQLQTLTGIDASRIEVLPAEALAKDRAGEEFLNLKVVK